MIINIYIYIHIHIQNQGSKRSGSETACNRVPQDFDLQPDSELGFNVRTCKASKHQIPQEALLNHFQRIRSQNARSSQEAKKQEFS